jgi:hypothetical protein
MGTPTFAASNPGGNQFLREYMTNRIDGKAMRALKIERESLIASLKATGQAQPATILNFNPVALRLDGGINFKVPSIIDRVVREEDMFQCTYKGRKYRATVLTIKEPIVYPFIKDVKKEEDVEVGIYEPRACKQIEIAHCFLTSYTVGTPQSSGMGGVVIFQGNRDALDRKDEKTGKQIVKVPSFIRLANKTREYFTEEKTLEEVITGALDMQRVYSNTQTQQAQTYWDQEDQRGNITPIHRVWHQFEIDMGWRQEAAPWVTLQNEAKETCLGCGETKRNVAAFFCHKCNRVYDPMTAYMAKEIPVTHPAMDRIKDADWTKVHKEEARRKALREGTTEEPKK